MTNCYFCTIFFVKMMNIEIVPIFDQSVPHVWDDFVRISAAAMRHVYNYKTSEPERRDAISKLQYNWAHSEYSFAFGATNGKTMVGFIYGDCADDTAVIQGLYVMPRYMSRRVGARLLHSAENAMTFVADTVELVSLANAQGFYEYHGYVPISRGSNHYVKQIDQEIRSTVVPVFRPTSLIMDSCDQIAQMNGQRFDDSDAYDVASAHWPMFVHTDAMSQICGFARSQIKNNSYVEQICIDRRCASDIIRNRLARALGGMQITGR